MYIDKCSLAEHHGNHPVYEDVHWKVFPNWTLRGHQVYWQMYTDKCSLTEHYGITRYMLIYIEKCFPTEHYGNHPVYADIHWKVFPNWTLWESPGICWYTLKSVSQLNTVGITRYMLIYIEKCSPTEHFRDHPEYADVHWQVLPAEHIGDHPEYADVHWQEHSVNRAGACGQTIHLCALNRTH